VLRTTIARVAGYRSVIPANLASFSKACVASMRRNVPERERITSECVIAPSRV
jgi:hypothetical protein